MKERAGPIYAVPISDPTKQLIDQFLKEVISPRVTVYSDESRIYDDLFLTYKHESVVHHRHEYVRGGVLTKCH